MIIDSLKYNGICLCGKEHKMETVFSVIESGCLKKANDYMEKYNLGGYTVAIYDENTYKATADRHLKANFEIVLNPKNLHANEHGVELLAKQLPEEANVLIAVGSGTIHDIVRYCGYQKGIDFVSCPTAASVDGFCSSVAAMTWNGCKKTLTAVAPKIVIADLDIIKNAPIRLAKSGFGDMVGKYIALTDWKIGNILNNEFYCNRIADMTMSATEAVIKSAEGILSGNVTSYEKLMYGLLLSGIAMQMLGNSRSASGAEHHISHIIEMEPPMLNVHSDALHGEKVGVGTLMAVKEYKRICKKSDFDFKDYEEYGKEDIYKFFGKKMGNEILKENAKDVASGITAEALISAWTDICREVAKIPDYDFLLTLYKKLGIKHNLSSIDVSNEMADVLLYNSPSVRNRLTLMRLRKCLKNIQE